MISLIIFLIILSVLVVVHEAGHLITAKLSGMRVDEFGLGYPPRAKTLFSYRGTEYTLNWLPFGGFVKIFGEDGGQRESDSDSFVSKPRYLQALVLVAGVTSNVIFAWILFSFLSNPVVGFHTTYGLLKEVVVGLAQFIHNIFSGHADFSEVSGPVGIVSIVGQVRVLGFRTLLYFTGFLSLNLAVLNLLPLPALDGGRLLFVVIESVIRRPVPARFQNVVNAVGFGALILLMCVITFRDVARLI